MSKFSELPGKERPQEYLTRQDLFEFQEAISHPRTYKSFIKELQRCGNSEICISTWGNDSIAYRCSTCARNANMALCVECFIPQKHIGHDYHKFSTNGFEGKCDCGDAGLMEEEGFCPLAFTKRIKPDEELLASARKLLPVFVVKTIQLITNNPIVYSMKKEGIENRMLAILQEFTVCSVDLRNIIVETLVSRTIFENNFTPDIYGYEEKIREKFDYVYHHNETLCSADFDDLFLKECPLDVLFCWATSLWHNHEVYQWFLKLSVDARIKEYLGRSFSRNYIGIVLHMLYHSRIFEKKYNSHLALTSQILTSESVSSYLFEEEKLPDQIFVLLHHLMTMFQRGSGPYDFSQARYATFAYSYWIPARDLNMLFGNKEFLIEFCSNDTYIYVWLCMVHSFQRLDKHVRLKEANDENDYAMTDYPWHGHNAVFEICIGPMLSLIHKFEETPTPLHHTPLQVMLTSRVINWTLLNSNKYFTISFHYPLLRILFLFFSSDMRKGVFDSSKVTFDHPFLKAVTPHLMRAYAAVAEIFIEFWSMNHFAITDHAKTYKAPCFSAGTVDPDIFAMQLASTQLNGDFVAQHVFEHLFTVYALNIVPDPSIIQQQPFFLVEQAMLYLAVLVAHRSLAGEDDDGLLRSEVVTILASREMSRSVLLEMIPYKGLNWHYKWIEGIDQVIEEVADVKKKPFSEQNQPLPNKLCLKWKPFLEEYDPVLVQIRGMHLGTTEKAFKNYCDCVERESLKPPGVALWPPFRSPIKRHHPYMNGYTNFLHSSSLHGFLFKVLYKCLYDNYAESALHKVVHLLNMSFEFPYYIDEDRTITGEKPLLRNCLVRYDETHNVLNVKGLLLLFNEINGSIQLKNNAYEARSHLFGYEEMLAKDDFHPTVASDTDLLANSTDEYSDESILSLLLKAFKKLTNKFYKPPALREPASSIYGSPGSAGVRIGGAEFFIGEVLDKLVEGSLEVDEFIEEYVEIEKKLERAVKEGQKDRNDAEDRRKRLVQKMKNRSKKEMERRRKLVQANYDDEEEEEDGGENEIVTCCLCAENIDKEVDHAVTVVFVTRTNLMGHRICKPHPFMSHDEENTFAYRFQYTQALSRTFFPKTKRVSEWFDNLWVQSCGHEMHFSCYRTLMDDSVTKKQKKLPLEERLKVYEREFLCPYCRQVCNGILPPVIKPIVARVPTKLLYPDYQFILSIFEQRSKVLIDPVLTYMIEHFSSLSYVPHSDASFYADLLRNNIEFFLMNKKLIKQQQQGYNIEYFPLTRLFRNVPTIILYNFCNITVSNLDGNKVIEMMRVLDPFEKPQRYNLAFADAKQLLVTTVIFMSQPTHELIKSVIHFFMNLYLLQLLSWMVVAADEEEIKAWIVEENLSGTHLDFILRLAIKKIKCGKIKKKKQNEKSELLTQTLTAKLTEFMKFCVVLYYSVLNFSDALEKDLESYELWDFYDPLLEGQLSGDDHISFVKCFGWHDEMIEAYVVQICTRINDSMLLSREFKTACGLFLNNWHAPRLITLPNDFDKLLEKYHQVEKRKRHANWVLVVCLVCSQHIFMKPRKNSDEKLLFDLAHTEKCGRGTCIYLEPFNNLVHIHCGKKTHIWDSIYGDKYVETSTGLQNFTSMVLQPERVHMLENMWLFNSFGTFSREWVDLIV